MIRPMFSKSFWTGVYSTNSGYSHTGPSKHSQNPGASYEMNAKRAQKSKNKDPFSVTAALATVADDNESTHRPESSNGSTAKIIDPSVAHGQQEKYSTYSSELERGRSQ